MTHGSLFSGIGGFDLAAEWMGWTNVFHCEWNPFGQKILKHYWPQSISYNDITTTDFTIHRGGIDIITGGFPCQPYSMAGKRLGKEDERHLWPHMCRAIREIQPRWVVGENVLGLVNWNGGLVFNEVQADLEAEGYEVQAFVLPAASVNAPHRRDRVWFVAYAKSARAGENIGRIRSVPERCDKWKENESLATYPDGNGFHQCHGEHEKQSSKRGVNAQREIESGVGDGDAADTKGEPGKRMQFEQRKNSKQEQREFRGNDSQMGSGWDVANADSKRREKSNFSGITEKQIILNRTFDAGISNWEKFPTQSPVCGRNDGIPAGLDGITFSKWRQESVKGYGNAIVPPLVYQIFKTIEQYENL